MFSLPNLAGWKLWLGVGALFVALAVFGYIQHLNIKVLEGDIKTYQQAMLTKEEELKSVRFQLQGAQEAYRTAIAEKHALVSDLYDNRLRLEERTKELQAMRTSHEEKVKTVRRTTDASGHFDACLPADVLSLYPNAAPCP